MDMSVGATFCDTIFRKHYGAQNQGDIRSAGVCRVARADGTNHRGVDCVAMAKCFGMSSVAEST
jgi:hypothetical protein